MNEARQVFDASWATQVIRVYANSTHTFEMEWTLGPVPLTNLEGKEVISRFFLPSNWNTINNGTWYTDSNAREMQDYKLPNRTSM